MSSSTASGQLASASGQSSQSGSGGNAKYLRYVKSKLSKSRLNSVLSIGGSSSSKEAQAQEIEQSQLAANSQQLAASGVLAEATTTTSSSLLSTLATGSISSSSSMSSWSSSSMARLEKQRLQVSSGEVELLAQRSQQLSLEMLTHRKPIGASLSNSELIGQQQAAGGDTPQPGNCLPPTSGSASKLVQQHQQQSSFKKSTFFQGFRYTLKGRRGSKAQQASQQEQQQALLEQQLQQVAADGANTIQQSHSLSSISAGQPTGSRLSGSKKFRQKLLLAGQASQVSTPSADASPQPQESPGELASASWLEQVNKCQRYTSSASTLNQYQTSSATLSEQLRNESASSLSTSMRK